eukprot:TRINITY_DN1731_c0_g2_i2.p1 TRINITY_DN1731_c0_g2~~TRINITY_DN1731_c0_g2_i2.p1  ORF type:complete len:123 (-),score=12.20 TRINITY_DN1731_c0_g2_i2:172-540(-)
MLSRCLLRTRNRKLVTNTKCLGRTRILNNYTPTFRFCSTESGSNEKPKVDPKDIAIASNTLNEIIKLELLQDHTKEDIEKIWKEYHIQKYCVAATIDRPTYLDLKHRLSHYSTFILPGMLML